MRHPYLEIGQIVSTHGIKGEVRVDPWCDDPLFMKQRTLSAGKTAGDRV